MALDMLREIQAFVSVAHKRSFVAAARALGRSPSAVTRAVQTLEDNAGSKLLNRNANAVTLTEAGERLLPHAERLLDVQRDAADELAALSGNAQGWIRFAAPQLLGEHVLPQVLAEFSRRHPQVTLDVQYSDEALDPLQGKFDFVVRGAFPQSSELIGYPLWPYRRHLYASPAYLALAGTPQHPEDLDGHTLIPRHASSRPGTFATMTRSPAFAPGPGSAWAQEARCTTAPWPAPASLALPPGSAKHRSRPAAWCGCARSTA